MPQSSFTLCQIYDMKNVCMTVDRAHVKTSCIKIKWKNECKILLIKKSENQLTLHFLQNLLAQLSM